VNLSLLSLAQTHRKLNLRFGLAAIFWLGSLEIIIIINLHSTFIKCLFDCFDVIYREFIFVKFHSSSSHSRRAVAVSPSSSAHTYRISIQTHNFLSRLFPLSRRLASIVDVQRVSSPFPIPINYAPLV
jgi:hypothetical protein